MGFARDANSKMLKLVPDVHKVVIEDAERVKEIFKGIHQQAEPGSMIRTLGIEAQELRTLGFDVKTEIGITGVVGILKKDSSLRTSNWLFKPGKV